MAKKEDAAAKQAKPVKMTTEEEIEALKKAVRAIQDQIGQRRSI